MDAWSASLHPSRLIRQFAIFALLLWLSALVALPIYELVKRSLYAEVPVAIFGPEEIRIGGHVVRYEDGSVIVDEASHPLEDGRFEMPGLSATLADDGFQELDCTRVMLYGRERKIDPVKVLIDGDRWLIDGVQLGSEDYQRTVSRFVGGAAFREYLSNPSLRNSLIHSLIIAISATAFAVTLAFLYAYGMTRTLVPLKPVFRTIAVLPLFAPTMLYGLSLIYLFGNQGLITHGFFEHVPWLAFNIELYGPIGIVIAETVFAFPAAFIVLRVALGNTDARLYEAAQTLGAGPLRIFWTVTIPGVRLGLFNAALICFTLAFTDFGAPKIVGGDYNVLAVDIYKQVVGQQNFSMGAAVSLILLAPAVLAFVLDRFIQRRFDASLGSRAVPYVPERHWPRDISFLAVCSLIALAVLILIFVAGYGSLVRLWPYDLSLGLKHYNFENVRGGYDSFWNSIRMSTYTAVIGTTLVFVGAFLIDRLKTFPLGRRAAYGLSVVPLALPGLVIGIAFVFLFNRADFRVPFLGTVFHNPLNALMGTMTILVLSSILHFYAVSFLTATTALRQLDRHYEEASESLSVPLYRLFFRVTVPVSLPALLEIAGYFFVSTMATVSAVIFLYSSGTMPAAVAIVNMDDAGDTAPAAAMCMLIVFLNIAVRTGLEMLAHVIARRTAPAPSVREVMG